MAYTERRLCEYLLETVVSRNSMKMMPSSEFPGSKKLGVCSVPIGRVLKNDKKSVVRLAVM